MNKHMLKRMIGQRIKLLAAFFKLLKNGYVYLDSQRALDISKFRIREISPNLFILGAAKSGTSSLHMYLNRWCGNSSESLNAGPTKEDR